MKKIEFNKDPVYIREYDVSVVPYLTHDQIKMIGDAIIAKATDSISEKSLICAFILLTCVKEDPDMLSKLDINDVMLSGFYDAIISEIVNFNDIYEYIEWKKDYKRRAIRFVDIAIGALKKVDWKKFTSKLDMGKIEKVGLNPEEEIQRLLDKAGVNEETPKEELE